MKRDFNISGPTVVDDGGNHRLDNAINPDLYPIELRSGSFHGVKQNGVQLDPDNLPPNVTMTGPAANYIGPNFSITIYGPLPAMVDLYEELARGGKDAEDAWVVLFTVVHDGAADMAYTDFTDGYNANIADNFTYSGALFNAIKSLMPIGWEWEEVRDWINSKTAAQLSNENTEVVEVWD